MPSSLDHPALASALASSKELALLPQAQSHIAAREYWASETRDGLQAPNREHGLRSYFRPTGVRVHDRTAEGSPRLLGLELTRMGRGDSFIPVAPGEVAHREGRVEITREQLGLVEWFENTRAGLEQGFTLDRPLAASNSGGALVLELAVAGARASLDGEQVVLATAVGRRLEYGKLVAEDASGRRLASHFEVPQSDRIRLVVDDHDASYPIVIDPLLTETADAQLESNQAFAGLGQSVAGAGDVNGDGYDDVIVGANGYDAGQADEGAAFVFLGSASGIADGNPANAATQIESNQANALLGGSVSGAGDVNGDGYADVIVGASSYDAGHTDEGAAFVFLGSASGVADGSPANAAAQLESNQANALLGGSVAGAGDVNGDGYGDVIVGAIQYDAGQTDEGTAFLFLGSASGIADGNPMTTATRLESNQAGARLGASVAGAGDVNGDGYDDVIVGANLFNAGQPGDGAAFVFLGSGAGIANGNPATAATQLDSNQGGAELGTSVAGAGDVNGDGYADVIVGAHYYDAGQTDEGAAFVFLGSASGVADGIPMVAAAQLESDEASAEMGYSVSSAGDVNGDGYADVIVGTPYLGALNPGAAFVYLGSLSGIADGNPTTAVARLATELANSWLGISVAGVGNVDGDGYADVIVGASLYNAGEGLFEGAAFVYHGNSTTPAEVVYTNAYYFGDSLSDTGNVFVLTGGAQPAAPYFNGRFSDGPVWVEYLASGIGLPSSSAPSLVGGNNLAFGGARTSGGSIPSLLTQVGVLTNPAGSLDANALYVVVVGRDDMRDARTNFFTMDAAGAAGRLAAAQTAAGNIRTALQLLAAAGARNVLVANLPDLGNTPEAFGLGLVAPSSDATAQFNAQFASVLSFGSGLGLNMRFLDLASLSAAIRTDALSNGGATYGITNVFTPCGSFQGSVGIACSVSAFSDALNPTRIVHQLIGNAAVVAVPEPEVLPMLLLGLTAVCFAARRRRAAR